MRILTLTLVLVSMASAGDFELGFILGEPTGISGKLWTGRTTAFDGAISWSLREEHEDDLYLHGDYLWHDFGAINSESGRIPIYYGIGGRIILDTDTFLGVRFPVGISWLLAGAPLDLFVELAGVLDIAPEVDFDLNGGLGVRFVF